MKKSVVYYIYIFLFFCYSLRMTRSRYANYDFGGDRLELFSTIGPAFNIFVILFILYLFNKRKIFDSIFFPYAILVLYTSIVTVGYDLLSAVSLDTLLSHVGLLLFPFLTYISAKLFPRNIQRMNALCWCFVVCFALLVYQNISFENVSLLSLDAGGERMTGAYIPLMFFPCILLHRSKVLHLVSFMVLFLVLLISGKRGGLFGLSVAAALYTLFYLNERGFRVSRIAVVLVLSYIAIGVAYNYILESATIQRFVDNGDYDVTSGRSDIYSDVINLILDSNIIQLLIGHGIGSVSAYTRNHLTAHNDFLEIFFDYGLIGFVLYLVFLWRIVTYLIKYRDRRSPLLYALSSWCAIFFTISFVSHLYEYPYFYIMTFTLGIIVLADTHQKTGVIQIKQLHSNKT